MLKTIILFAIITSIIAKEKTTLDLGLTRFIIVDKVKLKWSDAVQYCSNMNMTLFTPNTAERMEKLTQFFIEIGYIDKPNIGNDYIYWTSGKFDKKLDKYIWHSTGAEFNYTNWLPNMPDNWRGDELCVEMGFREVGKWNDTRCRYLRHFICEHSIEMELH
ncbi:PREDICTED: perlucin-like [Rhagoletis zephyria]|uniref:perlucin-like n=1 Tax=Rhagoletis zephyria TaxID=28612 RepID=UPI00081158A4|nr:PREDICTED: perlucin-like [Rhagoletis zephyria]